MSVIDWWRDETRLISIEGDESRVISGDEQTLIMYPCHTRKLELCQVSGDRISPTPCI